MHIHLSKSAGVVAVILAALLGVAGVALAAEAAKSPMALVLAKSDFPPKTIYEADDSGDPTVFKAPLESAGVDVESAVSQGILPYSKAAGRLYVTGAVFVTPSVAQAKKAFTIMKARKRFWWISTAQPLTLPAYGDQQMVLHDPAAGEGIWIANLVVRKRATLWALRVLHERRPAVSKAEFVAAVNTYARKQKARVGSG